MCAHLIVTLRAVLLAAVLGLGWIAAPAMAAPPDNNADVYRAVRDGTAQSITFTAPADKMLIQSEGQTWRQWRNGPITQIGGWMLAGVFVALVLFRLIRGKIVLEGALTGRLIQRFSTVERMTHWTVALSFMLLAITGLLLLFGKHVIIPVIGYSAFSWIAALGKNVHNFVGPLFFASTLVMAALFARDNVWQAIDALWIRKAGGLLSGEHVPSWRFNFGEKTWFWIGVVFLGLLVGITGLVLDFPGYGQIRQDMQLAHILHTSGAMIFIALSLGHIYIGSVGMEGSLESMKTGYVDETWAKEHHEYWYREAKGAGGAAPVASGSARPSTAH